MESPLLLTALPAQRSRRTATANSSRERSCWTKSREEGTKDARSARGEGRDAALPVSQDKATARWVRAQHQALAAWLASIEHLLARLTEVEPSANQVGQALRDLERLARELSEHFAREEAADGIFAKALAVAPRLERRVLALREQHGPLGAELEQVLQDAGYAGVAPDAWRRVAETFGAFAEALRTHERAENRIVADAYLEDLGSGD